MMSDLIVKECNAILTLTVKNLWIKIKAKESIAHVLAVTNVIIYEPVRSDVIIYI